MKRTILVCGHGPGISDAVARKFGKEGHPVALVARNAERLAAAEKALLGAGLNAKAFPCDLGDTNAVRALVRDVRAALGPIGVVHWNAYGSGAGDLVAAPDELRSVLDIGVHGMLAALTEALPDLEAEKGAFLITGGGFAFYDPQIDAMAAQYGSMGLAVAKAAQHKAAGMLNLKLAPKGVYVGEVIVTGLVKGTAFDSGHATLEPSDIAEKFWELAQSRAVASTTI
jgi:NADP-dependent 3-hydroxy acid dehydrogenase YdfG